MSEFLEIAARCQVFSKKKFFYDFNFLDVDEFGEFLAALGDVQNALGNHPLVPTLEEKARVLLRKYERIDSSKKKSEIQKKLF